MDDTVANQQLQAHIKLLETDVLAMQETLQLAHARLALACNHLSVGVAQEVMSFSPAGACFTR
jgi:hypothetical protein